MDKIGIISDTHGTLNGNALGALSGVDYILHAGDIGDPDVIKALQGIAPTYAVRGNMDGGSWCDGIPVTDMLELGSTVFYMLHDLNCLDLDPQSAGVQVVIHGHTHQSASKTRNGILYFNPGSASIRRYGGPLSVGRIDIADGRIAPRIIQLQA